MMNVRILHRTIKKVGEDIEKFSFNTSVSEFMICVNGLTELKCHKVEILSDLVITLAPFAPHIAEELWHVLGNESSIINASFPRFDEKYLVEDEFEYPVSFNGKTRFKIKLPLEMQESEIRNLVISHEMSQKWLEDREVRKIIIVPGKIINIVV